MLKIGVTCFEGEGGNQRHESEQRELSALVVDALASLVEVFLVQFKADEVPLLLDASDGRRAAAHEGVENDIPSLARIEHQRFHDVQRLNGRVPPFVFVFGVRILHPILFLSCIRSEYLCTFAAQKDDVLSIAQILVSTHRSRVWFVPRQDIEIKFVRYPEVEILRHLVFVTKEIDVRNLTHTAHLFKHFVGYPVGHRCDLCVIRSPFLLR